MQSLNITYPMFKIVHTEVWVMQAFQMSLFRYKETYETERHIWLRGLCILVMKYEHDGMTISLSTSIEEYPSA